MKTKLSILEASKICGFERSYFYKIIKKYNITITKDVTNKSYIDASELVRAIPSHLINNELLIETTENNTKTQETTHKKQQETTEQNNSSGEVLELLKKQVRFLEQQLDIAQSQVNNLLDTVNRQSLLLEHKKDTRNNTKTQETTHKKQQETTVYNTQKTTPQVTNDFSDIFTKLRNKKL